ncbi:MAG TPA: hypothetical protein VGT78_04710 [Rhizomicrobium sp.]|jgi:hypothetical protein|nr:hypothetical protein [Rhizomicrobium sp.]
MTIRRVLGAAIGGVIFAIAGVAVAANFSSNARADFFSPGKHQFYVWCAGAGDYMATEAGQSAEDAQMKLYDLTKAHGKSTCWPVWQGRVSG